MKSTVKTFPVMLIIDEESQAYNGDGKDNMDKAYSRNFTEYFNDNQSLIVESSFIGDSTVRQVIKRYLLEQIGQVKLDDSSERHYNESGNVAVVASTKEVGK